MGGHEVDHLGRGEFGGDDEVALVLAVFVVDENEHLALSRGGDDLLGGRNRAFEFAFDRSGFFKGLDFGHTSPLGAVQDCQIAQGRANGQSRFTWQNCAFPGKTPVEPCTRP